MKKIIMLGLLFGLVLGGAFAATNVFACRGECPAPTPIIIDECDQDECITPTPTPIPEIIVCLDGEAELTIPKTRQAWARVLYSYPNAVIGECPEPEVTPTPTPTATPSATPEERHDNPGAPVCGDSVPANVANIFVDSGVLNDGKLEVRWLPSEPKGNKAHIRYSEVDGQWRYALLNTDNDGHEEIGGLTNGTHYWFQVAQVNGCAVGNYSRSFDPLP